MKKLILTVQALILGFSFFTPGAVMAANSCYKTFVGIKPWYQYLEVVPDSNGGCKINYEPEISQTILRIAVAIVDMLIRIAGIVAFVSLVLSGFRFVTSQGDPNKEKMARSAAINSVAGLVIAITATGIVAFVTRSLIN